jgi:hypothetical protein
VEGFGIAGRTYDCERTDEDLVRCLLDCYNFGDEIAGHANDCDKTNHLDGAGSREETSESSVLCLHDNDIR